MSKDPDRYDPARDTAASAPGPAGPDHDRTLRDLLGPGAHEQERSGAEWVAGLAGVLLFLGLVVLLFSRVFTPS